jgi:hypothetical protein
VTKLRAPMSVEEALDRVLGKLTFSRAAEVTSRQASYLRKLSDPDCREQLTVKDLILLDVEHIAIDGTAPIFETVGQILKSVHGYVFSDEAELRLLAVGLMRENTQAEVALIEATAPGAPAAAWDRAEREVADVQPFIARILAFVRQRRERGQPAAERPP